MSKDTESPFAALRYVGEYRTIVADPPWKQPSGGPSSGPGFAVAGGRPSTLPYPTLSLDAIKTLPVVDLAAPNAHLYLWVTNAYVEHGYDVVRSWGFRPFTLLTWCKAPRGIGLGGTFTQTTEHVLYARRGKLRSQARTDRTWWEWKRGEHSSKPEAFMDIVEWISPGPRVELFSRRARLGWDVFGNESLSQSEFAA